ncbi:MAG TPA: transporter substrate-binding domain-containing protein [Coleofasciculaceae cyanobacterium]|jgi:polar amino acid transport system substrate-binding protein
MFPFWVKDLSNPRPRLIWEKVKLQYKTLPQLLIGLILTGGVGLISPPALAAELQEIVERGYLVVGVKDNLRPLAFKDEEGEIQGFEIDLARHLAQELLGSPEALVLQPLSNSERLSAVIDGKVDLTIAQLTATVSRSRVVSFSSPYYLDGTAFLTRRSDVQTFKDLQNQPIAVLIGSDTIATVRSLLPNATLVGVASYQAAKAALDRGQATVFAADASVLTGWVQEDSRYAIVSDLVTAEPLSVALPRGVQHDDLRRVINQAIDRWLSAGDLRQHALNWGLPEAGVPRSTTRP